MIRPLRTSLSLLAVLAPLASAVMATSTASSAADDVPPGAFPDATLADWKERRFSGSTDYALVEEDGIRALRGRTAGTASILYREREIDLERTPILEWSWKVDRIYPMIDERTQGGDDYPARLYVVARMGLLPWDTLALNYVWSSNETPDDSWPNPFTEKAQMIPVRAGAGEVGRWTHQRRDVAADFRAAFGRRVDEIAGYAVMVDGDNGDREATAWFGDIDFLPRVEGAAPSDAAADRR